MRRGLAALSLLAAALLAAGCTRGIDAGVTTIDQAEFVVSSARTIPPEAAPWKPVALPHDWRVSQPELRGTGWYRARFVLTPQANTNYALGVPFSNSPVLEFHVNGVLLTRNRDVSPPGAVIFHPVFVPIPPSLLRAGENVLHVRVVGAARIRSGLLPIAVGESVTIGRLLDPYLLTAMATLAFLPVMFLTGLVALALWRARRDDQALGWFGAAALAWAALALLHDLTRWDDLGASRPLLWFLLAHGIVPPLAVGALRILNRRLPWFERGLWVAYAGGAVAVYVLPGIWFGEVRYLFNAINVGLIGALFVLLLRLPERSRALNVILAVALVALGTIALHDLLRWYGIVSLEHRPLRFFQLPALLLVFGALVVEQHVRMIRATERLNVELEARVAEKTRALRDTYERMRATENERAVLHERQRIMRDMHDGLSGHLVGMLGLVQSRSAELGDVEQRLNETMTDLHAIVDSLEPVEGDLGVVLGNVRYRLRAAIEESGIEFRWQVEPLPTLDYLTPELVLAVQRIMLEALTNALRHAQARTVSVSAATDANAIVICIADDGAGFDHDHHGRGRGLSNMRERAEKIGAAFEVRTSPGTGTTIMLTLPAGHAAG